MLDDREFEQEKEQEKVLCGKSEKIDMDLPLQEVRVILDYAKVEKIIRQNVENIQKQDISDITSFFSVEDSGSALIKQKEKIQKELAVFIAENSDLANDERFSDTYYYRLAGFYELTKNYEKERECLSHIKDRENSIYAAKIAENNIRFSENTTENLQKLYNTNTDETARKLSGYYIVQRDFAKASDVLEHYIECHEEIPYEIYFQYAYVFMRERKPNQAIHLLRKAYYTTNTAQAALSLSMLYLVLSTTKEKLYKKAQMWCKIAVNTDISFVPAIRLFINMELEQSPEKTEKLLSRYMSLKTSKESSFYFDAAINHIRCAYVRHQFGEALSRLSELTDDGTNPAAVWNNIAMCNAGSGNMERAEKNIKKALEKYSESDKKEENQLQTILTNYMWVLNRQGKFKEAALLFKNTNGADNFQLSEDSYSNYFEQYRIALIGSGDFDTYFNFLIPIFMLDTDNVNLKYFACTDLLRLLTLTGEKTDEMYLCLDFLKQLYVKFPKGKHVIQLLNNIVFASLELDKQIPAEILKAFSSTIGRNPCNTATYGLYLLRVKHESERGLSYYDKAIDMARKNPKYSGMVEELKLKKELEAARGNILAGDVKSARRLLENTVKHCPENLYGYLQNARSLLSEC